MIAIIIFALIAQWWKEHAVIGWTIVGILVLVFIYTLVRHPPFRTRVTKAIKQTGRR
jgi:hypothetical protein